MLALIVKPVIMLVGIIAVVIGLVRAQPAHGDDLRRLILPNCAVPCWQGIQVDVTTREDALRLLEANPWVLRTYQTAFTVTWRWNGRQPPQFNGEKDGLLQIGGGVVRQIRIQTLIPYGEVWLLLGETSFAPDDARLVQPLTRYSAYQIGAYMDVGIQTISSFNCPVTPSVFWTAPITLGLGKIWSTEALNSRGLNIYHAPSWWRRLRNC